MSKEKELPFIREVIVVEGRDDTAAINRAVRAVTIETHGFGISKGTWDKLAAAYDKYGLIIFTDPDHAGNEIRKKILEKFPNSKEAFLAREKATEKVGGKSQRNTEGQNRHESKSGYVPKARPDIGIENASPEDILEALKKAKAKKIEAKIKDEFTPEDLYKAGLTGGKEVKLKREKLGDILGIGYVNSKSLIKKLNLLGTSREEFENALKKL